MVHSAVCTDGRWAADNDCSAFGQVCLDGRCSDPPECEQEGLGSCIGPFTVTCEDGRWVEGRHCADAGLFCVGGACSDTPPAQEAPDDLGPLFPPGAEPYGVPLTEYDAAFANWRTYPEHQDDCTLGQPPGGDIWFVIGHTQREETLRCTMPADRSLFIAGPSHPCVACPEVGDVDEECALTDADAVLACADRVMPPLNPFIQVDGETVEITEDYIIPTHTFRYAGNPSQHSRIFFRPKDSEGPGVPPHDIDCLDQWQEGNVCGEPAGPKLMGNKTYAFLFRRFEPGEHEVDFYIKQPSGQITQHIRVDLRVVPAGD